MNHPGIRYHMILLVCTLSLVLTGFFRLSAGKTSESTRVFPLEWGDNGMSQGPSHYVTGLTSGKLLVAGQNIRDPRFYRTVILLVTHDRRGSMGIIINRPTAVKISDALPKVNELRGGDDPLFYGGPVGFDQIQILFQTRARYDEARHVFDDIFFSISGKTILRMILEGGKDERFRVYAGYAGWTSGQLEHEVMRGDWYILQADADTVFHADPSAIWPEMIRRVSGRWWVSNQQREETAQTEPW